MRTSIKVLFMGLPADMKDPAACGMARVDGWYCLAYSFHRSLLLGSQAPDARTVKSVLHAACANSDAPDDPTDPHAPREPRRTYKRKLSDPEVLTTAKLLCDGLSRKAVTREVRTPSAPATATAR